MVEKTFGEQVLNFYQKIEYPSAPQGIEVLYPYSSPKSLKVAKTFYENYYSSGEQRTFLIGINPCRLGGGTTGVPFTDPIRLEKECGIENDFEKKAELSSKFVYKIIEEYGGPKAFYNKFYFTSVCPLGFVKQGKNLNYYDDKELYATWKPFIVKSLKEQISFGANKEVAFSMGMGLNIKYLKAINDEYNLFKKIVALPHPRWVMQYRLKRIDEFILEYITKLSNE